MTECLQIKQFSESVKTQSLRVCLKLPKLPPMDWFKNEDIKKYIPGLGPVGEEYIKTHLDIFYNQLRKHFKPGQMLSMEYMDKFVKDVRIRSLNHLQDCLTQLYVSEKECSLLVGDSEEIINDSDSEIAKARLISKLTKKNKELEELVKKQQEQLFEMSEQIDWINFLDKIHYTKFKRMSTKEYMLSLTSRALNNCVRAFKELPSKQWFLENDLGMYIPKLTIQQEVYIKRYIDFFYPKLLTIYTKKDWYRYKYKMLKYNDKEDEPNENNCT